MFVRTDEDLALFVVYGGQRYDDSPRFVYEYLKSHSEYKHVRCVWAFLEPEKIEERVERAVRIDTFRYYITALKAKYWITNSSCSRGLNFMKRGTVNILFQHGMAGIKKIGRDVRKENKSFGNAFHEEFKYIVIEGKLEADILKRAWRVSENQILNIGLPRNDELAVLDMNRIAYLKKYFGISDDKKIILYAPTFREFNRDIKKSIYLKPPFDFDIWKKKLGDEYVLIVTAHYEVEKIFHIPEENGVIVNAFKYPRINDLLMISDLLISDYSSVIFDYSILGRPIISYAYDYDRYKKERDLYEGYENIFSHGVMKTQEEVMNHILNLDYQKECEFTRKNIRDKYISHYGNAAKRAVEIIFR